MTSDNRLIIDCDPGVDDFVAIVLALKSKRLNVEALTIVNGNSGIENGVQNALKTIDLLNENIPVYRGVSSPLQGKKDDADYVHGNNGFGGIQYEKSNRKCKEENAVDFLIKKVNKNPGKFTIAAVGPLTNIASAIKKDANFEKNVKELLIMGGGEKVYNILGTSEFNFYSDAEAVHIVMNSNIKSIKIIDLDVTVKATLNSKMEKFLIEIANENPLAKFWYDITRIGADFDRKNMHTDGLIINDAVVIGYLLNNEILNFKKANILVSTKRENAGHIDVLHSNFSNIQISTSINEVEFLKSTMMMIFPEYGKRIEQIFV